MWSIHNCITVTLQVIARSLMHRGRVFSGFDLLPRMLNRTVTVGRSSGFNI